MSRSARTCSSIRQSIGREGFAEAGEGKRRAGPVRRAPRGPARRGSAALGDAQERLPAALVALAAPLLLGALLGVAPTLLGAPRALAQVGGVEILGPDRLLDEHEDVLARHLDVALALR